jgi:iron complex outermembrane receptor protein
VYYRDESLTFYPFPTLTKGQVSSFSSSQQDTDQYGAKLTLNSQPLAGWDLTWGLDADHETFNANQMFFDLHNRWRPAGCTTNRSTPPAAIRDTAFQRRAVPAVQL